MNYLRLTFLALLCLAITFSLNGSAVSGDGPKARTARPDQPTVGQRNVETSGGIASAGVADGPRSNAAIGALFAGDGHYCTASVVHSDAGDLVLTAAHCIHEGAGGDYLGDLTFAPGYGDGKAPYGMWTVTKALVSPGWIASSDADLDVGFLTVHQNGNPHSIESVTGANQLGIGAGFVHEITLTGYPDEADAPVSCRNTTSRQSEFQLRIACPGFPNGTSGGPWVTAVDPSTNLGTVIGVVGGYQLGGDDADVSYSSYFDSDIKALYANSSALG